MTGEVEAALLWQRSFGRLSSELRVNAYTANVDNLIVWQPDYRFIWSPRNVDVRRNGAEASLSMRVSQFGVSAWVAHNRVSYDEIGAGDVQVAYRPRHAANITLDAGGEGAFARVEARYVGGRNTAPTDLNALPGFWTAAASAGASRTIGAFRTHLALRIDRVFDERDALIFGFPHAGRLLSTELRVTEQL